MDSRQLREWVLFRRPAHTPPVVLAECTSLLEDTAQRGSSCYLAYRHINIHAAGLLSIHRLHKRERELPLLLAAKRAPHNKRCFFREAGSRTLSLSLSLSVYAMYVDTPPPPDPATACHVSSSQPITHNVMCVIRYTYWPPAVSTPDFPTLVSVTPGALSVIHNAPPPPPDVIASGDRASERAQQKPDQSLALLVGCGGAAAVTEYHSFRRDAVQLHRLSLEGTGYGFLKYGQY